MNGTVGDSTDKEAAFQALFHWLEKQNLSKCILLSHNAKALDVRVILQAAKAAGVYEEFEQKCRGFIDSLPPLRSKLLDKASYTLGSLYNDLCSATIVKFHDSKEDVRALCSVLLAAKASLPDMVQFSFSIKSAEAHYNHLHLSKILLDTMKRMVREKIIIQAVAKRIANSGLDLQHLRLAFRRKGVDGVRALLSEKHPSTGKPRVSKTPRILQAVADFVATITKCLPSQIPAVKH